MDEAVRNKNFRDALRTIFGDDEVGLAFLENPERSRGVPGDDPVEGLMRTLTGYVISMANELRELGEDEKPRLQAEARATLIAIREVDTWLGFLRKHDSRHPERN